MLFMEISTHLFLPCLSNLRIRNEFTDLLFNVCSHYMSSREDSPLLSEIRQPVWSYIINLCSSFTPARDCNACFSQIFEQRTFGYLYEEEESLFMTLRTFYSFCSSCSNFVTLNSSILSTVVTVHGLNQSGLDKDTWPLFVTEMHTNPGRLNCTNCNIQTSIKYLLIFQQLYAQDSIYIHYKSINKLSKAGTALVDTISSYITELYKNNRPQVSMGYGL